MSKSTISTFQLFERFPDAESARIYLEGRLWPKGSMCPECKSSERITTMGGKYQGYYRCNACDCTYTVRTGTIFERSHIPLHKWLYAMYLLVTSRKGISSMQLAKEIGITQKSAWFMLGRLREACSAPDSIDKLKGIVEIDETLDAITDIVLAYKPKPKTKAAIRRKRKIAKAAQDASKSSK
jgi:transposase-like protein